MTHEEQTAARKIQLRVAVAEHKAAIRRHRLELGRAAAELLELEARATGISITKVPTGVGAIHGHRHPAS